MVDLVAIAETLEAQAGALRREAARLAGEGQAELELTPAVGSWVTWEGGEQPESTYGKVVDVRLRDGYEMSSPASALVWLHNSPYADAPNGSRDIIAFRISADE
jgi:hypothetical protein